MQNTMTEQEAKSFLAGILLASTKIRHYAAQLAKILNNEEMCAKPGVKLRTCAVLNVLKSLEYVIAADSGDAIEIEVEQTEDLRKSAMLHLKYAIEGQRESLEKIVAVAKERNLPPEEIAALEEELAKAPNDSL